MKTQILTLFSIFIIILNNFTGCASADSNNKSNNLHCKSRKIMVRLTTYSKTEAKCDKWTRRGQSSTGIRLKEGVTAAVDPNIIPYFSKIELPEVKLSLVSLDTGSAVVKRTASRKTGGQIIIDVFFEKESTARQFRLNNPEIVEAHIY